MNNLLLILNNMNLFGIDIIDVDDFTKLLFRFVFNTVSILIIVRYLYYPIAKRKDYLFTYILISASVFLLCFLLDNVKLQLGFALGLFAIFGIIRYRTNPIPIKEMTYLFIIIGISVINALANKKVSYAELLFANLSIIIITWGLEKVWLLKHESCKTINYDNIELIKPERRKELVADIEKRTGLKIHKIEVGKIDFLKDMSQINIYYFGDFSEVNQADEIENMER
jgi:hypothetical protein